MARGIYLVEGAADCGGERLVLLADVLMRLGEQILACRCTSQHVQRVGPSAQVGGGPSGRLPDDADTSPSELRSALTGAASVLRALMVDCSSAPAEAGRCICGVPTPTYLHAKIGWLSHGTPQSAVHGRKMHANRPRAASNQQDMLARRLGANACKYVAVQVRTLRHILHRRRQHLQMQAPAVEWGSETRLHWSCYRCRRCCCRLPALAAAAIAGRH